ncbi:hypothetical protein [Mangrovibacterium sp.]|uniref:hypothetical protein n=1 Tax=Mangrovibacterium sp. TaxID=1961364 RepID=UPI003569C14B
MNNIYTFLSRFQFNALYKSGEINIDLKNCIDADMPESVLIKKMADALLLLPFFEYDEEYLIIGAKINSNDTSFPRIEIPNIDEVLVLSNEAKLSLSTKLDNRIQLSYYPWCKQVLSEVQQLWQLKIQEKGVDALWKISGFQEDWKTLDFLPPNLTDDIFQGLKARESYKSKDKQFNNLIIQSIVYDRTEFFPEGYDGYLFDLFEIMCNHLQEGYQFKSTQLFPVLEELHYHKPGRCWEFFKLDRENKNLEAIKTKFRELTSDNLRWEYVFAWFLSQKEYIQKKGEFNLEHYRVELERTFDEYKNERKVAVIMLGAFFGYKYFYDALYDSVTLKFFKPKKTSKGNGSSRLAESSLKSQTSNSGSRANKKQIGLKNEPGTLLFKDDEGNETIVTSTIEDNIEFVTVQKKQAPLKDEKKQSASLAPEKTALPRGNNSFATRKTIKKRKPYNRKIKGHLEEKSGVFIRSKRYSSDSHWKKIRNKKYPGRI